MSQQQIHNHLNLEISTQIQKNPHNVVQYRTERKIKIKQRRQQARNESLPQIISKDSINLFSFNQLQLGTSVPLRTHSNKTRKVGDQDNSNKFAATTFNAIDRSKSAERCKNIGKTLNLASGFTIRLSNKYKQIQKDIHKGKNNLNMKSLERWLNDLLIQYCSGEKFQANIQNPALKKFQIDRNSLISKGVDHQNIDRVYRSLFVYSLGFNKLLEDICVREQSISVRKTLWKVYAMLLQYCAKGQFQTMIGEIQRDKTKKVQNLRGQIAKYQKVIDNAEQSGKQQRLRLYKQMKLIKDSNQGLLSEINILQNDFKKAEIAFNQQVSLRLRFQHKINEIYGVHQELSMKHGNLYKDYNILVEQYRNQKNNLKKEVSKKGEAILKILDLEGRLDESRIQKQSDDRQIQKLLTKIRVLELKLDSIQTHRNTGLMNTRNELRQNKILHLQLNNTKQVLSLKQKSFQQLQRRVTILVSQNQRLFERVEEQNKRIIQLDKNQHEFQLTTLNLKSALDIKQSNEHQFMVQKKKQENKILEMQKKIGLWEVEVKTGREKIKMLTNDLQVFNKNLEIMKTNKNNIEDQLKNIKLKYSRIMETLNGRQTAQAKLLKQLNDAQHEIIKVKEQLYNVQTMLTVKQEDFKHQKLNLKRIIDKLVAEKDTLRDQKEEAQNKLILLEQENQKCKKYQEIAKKQLIDMTFQKTNTDLKFKQSLLMIEDQTKYIKDLNITISHLHQQKQDVSKQLSYTKAVLTRKEEEYQKQKRQFQKLINTQKLEIERKIGWIHPMRYADLQGQCLQNGLTIAKKNREIMNRCNQLEITKESNKKQTNDLKVKHMKQFNVLQKQYQKKYIEKEDHLEQLKKKINKVQSELNKKQKIIQTMSQTIQSKSNQNIKQTEITEQLQKSNSLLKNQIEVLKLANKQKVGDVKAQQSSKLKINQLLLQIKKLEKKVQALEKQLKAKYDKQKQDTKIQQQINNNNNNNFNQQIQTPQEKSSDQVSNKLQMQKMKSITQKSENQQFLQMQLLPKTHVVDKTPSRNPILTSEQQKQNQKQRTTAKKPAVMTRKQVVNKMYSAYNYYHKK